MRVLARERAWGWGGVVRVCVLLCVCARICGYISVCMCGNFCETGWSAYGLFRAHRYHLELNWPVERNMKLPSRPLSKD